MSDVSTQRPMPQQRRRVTAHLSGEKVAAMAEAEVRVQVTTQRRAEADAAQDQADRGWRAALLAALACAVPVVDLTATTGLQRAWIERLRTETPGPHQAPRHERAAAAGASLAQRRAAQASALAVVEAATAMRTDAARRAEGSRLEQKAAIIAGAEQGVPKERLADLCGLSTSSVYRLAAGTRARGDR